VRRGGLALGIVALLGVVVVAVIVLHNALGPLIAIGAVIGLIAGGNALYGKNTHYARAYGRMRPDDQAPRPPLDPLPPAPEGFTVPDTLEGLGPDHDPDAS
jgi:hypothetical protein